MKKTIKMLVLLVGVIIIFSINISKVYATNITGDEIKIAQSISLKDIQDKAKNFIQYGSNNQINGLKEDEIVTEFAPVGRILVFVATGVFMIVAVVMGIKWITANPEQQAKLKEQLWGLIFAIFVVYGAVGIWELVKLIMDRI